MGLMDELRKLTTPYEEDEDFFEGAEENKAPAPQQTAIQAEFENTFGTDPGAAPEPARKPNKLFSGEGGRIGAITQKRTVKAKPAARENVVSFGGSETKVILFNPHSFDEASELVGHLRDNRSLVMTLEGIPTDTARRLLDFLSGVTYALDGKITPVSAKTYFITPHNVDIVGNDQPETDSQYL